MPNYLKIRAAILGVLWIGIAVACYKIAHKEPIATDSMSVFVGCRDGLETDIEIDTQGYLHIKNGLIDCPGPVWPKGKDVSVEELKK